MGCFEDLMQFRDEVDRAEEKIRARSGSACLSGRQRQGGEKEDQTPSFA